MSVCTLSISHEGSDFFIRLIAANVSTTQVAIMMEWTQSPSRSGLYYEDFVAEEELDLLLDLRVSGARGTTELVVRADRQLLSVCNVPMSTSRRGTVSGGVFAR